MSNDNVIQLIQPGIFDDQLTEVLRNGARALLAKAVEAEVADFLGQHADLKTADGHQRVVRHGHLPEREVMTGIGPVAVRQPRVRDREAAATDPGRIRFSPSILPPYMRRSKSIETLLPILYLKGISTGDFSEALAALLGKDAAGLSASAIGRLKDGWIDEHAAWQKRDLSAKRYIYIWADGIHLQARLEDEKQCILVLIGATPEGRKELVGFTDGARESAHDWRDLLLDLKRRGLDLAPQLAIADGALGFWKAAGEVWPKTREQRCWVHKTANVLTVLNLKRLVQFATQHHLPLVGGWGAWAKEGGLFSYGPDSVAMAGRAANYIDKIFKGANPGDLPVEQPAKFELIINLKTANLWVSISRIRFFRVLTN
ncbi:IS256 family transposase [Bradyrhizobium barranii subsp. barranii]|uniref:Mutator family transposase n=1 Tax=Bradyrhizobium barranii subsp. barranii TaxID=2823807 RepID=A0A9X9XUB0_9BRAD|nr:IS256 family transposase [Bradyrhizobium barranii subsp. barranii]